ncbi:MAG: hypothetical protein MJK04_30650, partial [Psychrosphaera sp.]|nr:hypothetical protein [Psychrosphaera sp.]
MNSELLEKIRLAKEVKPSIGLERENFCVRKGTFEPINNIADGSTPLFAVRQLLQKILADSEAPVVKSYVEELVKCMIEVNGEPTHGPRSAAMSIRLLTYITDRALQLIDDTIFPLHGSTWQPVDMDGHPEWITQSAGLYKWAYFSYILQGRDFGNRYASACGDHFNISAPWIDKESLDTRTIEVSGRLRYLSFLFVPFTSGSPLCFDVAPKTPGGGIVYNTTITPFDSGRMGSVWPAREEMDVSGIYRAADFRETIKKFARRAQLIGGGDIHIPVRPQPVAFPTQSFEDFAEAQGIDIESPDIVKTLLFHCFRHGDGLPEEAQRRLKKRNLLEQCKAIDTWRMDNIEKFIAAQRNRIEIRVLEAPFSFDDQSGYEYEKSLYTYLELLFIWACEDNEMLGQLEIGEEQLTAAQGNEHKAERYGLDGIIHWTPNMKSFCSTRDALKDAVFPELEKIAQGLGGGRMADLRIIREIIYDQRDTPSQRIRKELLAGYQLTPQQLDGNASFPVCDRDLLQGLLDRNRRILGKELEQIKADVASIPAADQAYITGLIETA